MAQSSIRSFDAYLKARQEKAAAKAAPDPSDIVMKALVNGPLSVSALLKATDLPFTAVADLLAKLEDFGLVRREDKPDGKVFHLTDEGRKAAQSD